MRAGYSHPIAYRAGRTTWRDVIRWRDSGDRSSATCPHHGPAGANPVQTRWLRLGLFQSICPTIKYQPGKANVVADALSRSQRKLEEGPTDDMATATAMIERHVSTLSGASVELIVPKIFSNGRSLTRKTRVTLQCIIRATPGRE